MSKSKSGSSNYLLNLNPFHLISTTNTNLTTHTHGSGGHHDNNIIAPTNYSYAPHALIDHPHQDPLNSLIQQDSQFLNEHKLCLPHSHSTPKHMENINLPSLFPYEDNDDHHHQHTNMVVYNNYNDNKHNGLENCTTTTTTTTTKADLITNHITTTTRGSAEGLMGYSEEDRFNNNIMLLQSSYSCGINPGISSPIIINSSQPTLEKDGGKFIMSTARDNNYHMDVKNGPENTIHPILVLPKSGVINQNSSSCCCNIGLITPQTNPRLATDVPLITPHNNSGPGTILISGTTTNTSVTDEDHDANNNSMTRSGVRKQGIYDRKRSDTSESIINANNNVLLTNKFSSCLAFHHKAGAGAPQKNVTNAQEPEELDTNFFIFYNNNNNNNNSSSSNHNNINSSCGIDQEEVNSSTSNMKLGIITTTTTTTYTNNNTNTTNTKKKKKKKTSRLLINHQLGVAHKKSLGGSGRKRLKGMNNGNIGFNGGGGGGGGYILIGSNNNNAEDQIEGGTAAANSISSSSLVIFKDCETNEATEVHTKDTTTTTTTTNKDNNSNTNVINISQHTTTTLTPTTISSANNKNTDDVAALRASVVDDGQQEEGGQHPQRMDTHNNANDQSSGSGNSADSLATESPKAAAADLSNKTDYIHVRARRGQATDSHSLAERVRREKISERMKYLQDLVPGCSKVTGKALMLDEIINYVQSLQRQVEFLSMKLAAMNPITDYNMTGLFNGREMIPLSPLIFNSHHEPPFAQGKPNSYPSLAHQQQETKMHTLHIGSLVKDLSPLDSQTLPSLLSPNIRQTFMSSTISSKPNVDNTLGCPINPQTQKIISSTRWDEELLSVIQMTTVTPSPITSLCVEDEFLINPQMKIEP